MDVQIRFSRRAALVATAVLLGGCGAARPPGPGRDPAPSRTVALSFAPNAGQADARVRFLARTGGASLFLTAHDVAFALTRGGRGVALKLRFAHADPRARLEAGAPDGGTLNSLVGPRSRWRRGLPTYRTVIYRGLWPGVDLVVGGATGRLKYEFHVAPRADVGAIRLAYRGADGLTLGRDGGLEIHTGLGALRDAPPVSYQPDGGRVAGRYVVRRDGYGFALGAGYDPARPLIIDPEIEYSSLLGGADSDEAMGIAVGADGSAYLTGRTLSADYPTTPGAFDPSRHGPYGTDAFVTKLDPSGAAAVYSTLLGGADTDEGLGIAVDRAGSAYVTGQTWSPDYPTTAEPPPATGGGDAFVTKLTPDGSALAYSRRLAGAGRDTGLGIAVGDGGAYVTGYTASEDYPTTPGAADTTFNGATDVFVTRLGGAGELAYSTFAGGSGNDAGAAVAVDRGGGAYVTGRTASADYPVSSGTAPAGGFDAFVTKLSPRGSRLAYSTLLGSAGLDAGAGVAVDGCGTAYVTGLTAGADFPTTAGAADPSFNGGTDAFVAALRRDGSAVVYSTFLGGSGRDEAAGIAVDAARRAFVTGQTWSTDLPTTPDAADPALGGVADAFVGRLSDDGSTLEYSTFLGGAGFDAGTAIAVGGGAAYVAGQTLSGDYPVTDGAFDTTFNGQRDGFVTRLATGDRRRAVRRPGP